MNQIKVLDAGNTRLKLAVFENDTLINVLYFENQEALFSTFKKNEIIVLASVLNDDFLAKLNNLVEKVILINHHSITNFNNKYASPETLGIDRVCNVVAMKSIQKHGNRLSVDIGTCIKFDFLNESDEYLGGSISPGLLMRFKALNTFTAKLPLIEPIQKVELIGDTSKNSILSGVQNGMNAEINGLLNRYIEKYDNLTIFITGGDAHYFDFEQKNNIFADENLTLKGIFELYKLNATHA